MKDGFSIFDTHTHLGVGLHHGRRITVEDLLREMDDFGVDRSLVIPFPVVEDYRATHDEIAHAVQAHPDRFVGAACLYPYLRREEFRTEVKRCVEELGFRAIKLQPQYHALNPLWPTSEFFFATAQEYNLPIVVHTGSGIPYSLPSLYIVPARQFPDLKIILGHCGGGGLLLAEAIVAAQVCPNIYLELSSLMPHHIAEVLQHVPSTRLMIGSDLPESLTTELSKILFMHLAPEMTHDIFWNTAQSLFL